MPLSFFRRRPPKPLATTDALPGEAAGSARHASSPGVPPGPLFVRLSLATATRDYAEAVEAGRLERLTPRDLDRLYAAMGPHLWAWQRAKRLTSQPIWRASSNVPEARERVRATLAMTEDVATWERALVAIDAETAQAVAYGRPPPPPLDVPPLVQDAIEARRAANLERATRRGNAIRGDGSGRAPSSDDGSPPPTSAKTR